MKKSLKATAAVLAVSVTLTACANSADDVNIDKKALNLYAKSPVTQVEEQPFTLDGVEGLYTGDWKGDRPEGNGEFVISQYDYYSGEWYNGILYGQGKVQKTCDDGTWKYFEGECAYNAPSGEGVMYIGGLDGSFLFEINGDFSDESSLLYYLTDEEGRLTDLGGIQNGEYVSYVDNPNVMGGSVTRMINDDGYIYSGGTGEYIGQIDQNGLPNGYGYFESCGEQPNGQYRHWHVLSTWKDGYMDGYYIILENIDDKLFRKTVGCKKDGKAVGEFACYTTKESGLSVEKKNFDTYDDFDTFELGEDGIYRGSYATVEYFNNDGTYGFQRRRRTYKLLEDGSLDYEYTYRPEGSDEGEYCNYDKNDNLIDYGVPLASGWKSLKDNSITLKDVVITLGVALVASYAIYKVTAKVFNLDDFENSSAGRYLQRNKEEAANYLAENNVRKALQEKAEEEARLGHYDEADKLLDEAEKHHICIW